MPSNPGREEAFAQPNQPSLLELDWLGRLDAALLNALKGEEPGFMEDPMPFETVSFEMHTFVTQHCHPRGTIETTKPRRTKKSAFGNR